MLTAFIIIIIIIIIIIMITIGVVADHVLESTTTWCVSASLFNILTVVLFTTLFAVRQFIAWS